MNLLGKASPYLDRMANEPLSFATPVTTQEDAVGYVDGGRVPRGTVFVVTRVTWTGTAAGDGNGHGELVVKLGQEALVRVRDDPGPVRGEWVGRFEVLPGREESVSVEVANSSTADVRVEGMFETSPAPQEVR